MERNELVNRQERTQESLNFEPAIEMRTGKDKRSTGEAVNENRQVNK